jgi:hypothetical protein
MLGWMFSWFSGGDDEDDTYTSPRQVVPTTRIGWGPARRTNHPARDEARVQHPGFVTIA